eukprot:976280-Pelagomonas_calceolata.AAC.2
MFAGPAPAADPSFATSFSTLRMADPNSAPPPPFIVKRVPSGGGGAGWYPDCTSMGPAAMTMWAAVTG